MRFSRATVALALSSILTPESSQAFQIRPTTTTTTQTTTIKPTSTSLQQLRDDGSDAVFGGNVPGMPDKPPKAPPVDEDNPMGGEMFRRMMEQAEKRKQEGGAAGMMMSGMQQDQPQPQAYSQPPPPPVAAVPAAPAPQQPANDPQAYYQMQLQAWQQQMTAFAQFSAANPEAAASMTMPPPPPPPPVYGQPVQQQPPPVSQQQEQPQQQQYAPPTPPPPQPTEGVKEKEGIILESDNPRDYLPKPVQGRNTDAYEVTNPADIYFAQLKRDSQVRNLARKEGDIETANRPFAEKGVQALKDIIDPALMEQRRKTFEETGGEFMTSQDEMILPYADDGDEVVDKASTGVSYKDKLAEMKRKRAAKNGGGVSSPPVAASAVPEVKEVAVPEPAKPAVEVKPYNLTPMTVPEPTATAAASPATPVTEKTPENPQNFALPTQNEENLTPISAPSMEDSETDRRNVRTLMGLLLKHRGGPGFGSGRLRENDARRFEGTLVDVLELLKRESGVVGASSSSSEAPVVVEEEKKVEVEVEGEVDPQMAGAVACVEGALSMYKKSTPVEKEGMLLPLRDALLSAANTINKVIAENEVENVRAYEEAAGMSGEKVGPEPVAAVSESVEVEEVPVADEPEEVEITAAVEESSDDSSSSSSRTSDIGNSSERLQKAYEMLAQVQGQGKFGLRAVSPEELSHVSELLMDVQAIIMDELDTGITDDAGVSQNAEEPATSLS